MTIQNKHMSLHVESSCVSFLQSSRPERDASYINASIQFEPIYYSESEIQEAIKKLKMTHRYEDFLDILFHSHLIAL